MKLNLKFTAMTTDDGTWPKKDLAVSAVQAESAASAWVGEDCAEGVTGLMRHLAGATGYTPAQCLRGADKLAQRLRRASITAWDKQARRWIVVK